jgi:hypothetical protein
MATKTKVNVLNVVRKAMEGTGKYIVVRTGNTLTLSCMYKGRSISMRLILQKNNLLDLDINYVFKSTISHFHFGKTENRFCQNKVVLKTFILALRKTEVWHHIDKSFLRVNDLNKTSNKTHMKEELKDLLGID